MKGIKAMDKVRLTTGRVDGYQCQPGKAQSFLWDTEAPGLGLRATPSGAKAYIFQSKLNGQTIRITIGTPATWTLESARIKARRLKTEIDEGRDPRQVQADALAAEKAARDEKLAQAEALKQQELRNSITLGQVWPVYIETRRKRWSDWHIRDHENVARPGGVKKIRGKGNTEPGPLTPLLPIPLKDLTSTCIADWLASETKDRPTQAALSFRLLSVFVNWCESQPEYANLIPAGACKAPHVRDEIPSKNTKEGDSLQREQLAPWFKAVRAMSNPVQSAYLQALLLTGARRRELAGLRWADVDFQWQSLTIRDKVEGERTIPLTPYVAHLLAALPRDITMTVDGKIIANPWVFSSPSAASGQLAEPTPGHKRALLAAGLPTLTLHGLRRSFGSLAEWTEAPTGIVAQIMGHKPSAIAEKHYRRRPLDLLRMWHSKIEAWILQEAGIDFNPDATRETGDQ